MHKAEVFILTFHMFSAFGTPISVTGNHIKPLWKPETWRLATILPSSFITDLWSCQFFPFVSFIALEPMYQHLTPFLFPWSGPLCHICNHFVLVFSPNSIPVLLVAQCLFPSLSTLLFLFHILSHAHYSHSIFLTTQTS